MASIMIQGGREVQEPTEDSATYEEAIQAVNDASPKTIEGDVPTGWGDWRQVNAFLDKMAEMAGKNHQYWQEFADAE